METIKTAWEQDLNFLLLRTRDLILNQIHSSSLCARHALLQFKVIHHIHMSKTRLAWIYPNVDPTCEKCASCLARPYVLVMSLSGHQSFRLIRNTKSSYWAKSYDCYFWHHSRFGFAQSKTEGAAFYFFTFSMSWVLLKWKNPAPPSHSQWTTDILLCLNLETIRYSIRGVANKFQQVWSPFLTFIEKPTTVISPFPLLLSFS